ncbi:hypothetical protein CDAR_410141 [Caerostris darwini]|uniref:Uncharacterized protein n=1 Tax=Caerostris darwini TaxID=1538125 RepID=A0AAV4VYN2_9ARAC|nr:hypothetical protein CDAR_410141 [Caerostris darwini]
MTVGRGRKTEKTTKWLPVDRENPLWKTEEMTRLSLVGRLNYVWNTEDYRVVPCCSVRFETNIQCLPKLRHSRNGETSNSSASDCRVVPCWNEKTTGETCDDQVGPGIEIKSTGKHFTSKDPLVVDKKNTVKRKSRL